MFDLSDFTPYLINGSLGLVVLGVLVAVLLSVANLIRSQCDTGVYEDQDSEALTTKPESSYAGLEYRMRGDWGTLSFRSAPQGCALQIKNEPEEPVDPRKQTEARNALNKFANENAQRSETDKVAFDQEARVLTNAHMAEVAEKEGHAQASLLSAHNRLNKLRRSRDELLRFVVECNKETRKA